MSGLLGWLRPLANSASEEAECKARESDSEMDGPMSVSMAMLGHICLHAKESHQTKVRIREVDCDRSIVAYLQNGDEQVMGELAAETSHMLAGKIRSLGNVNGWASLHEPRDVFELKAHSYRFEIRVRAFQLKPSLLVDLEISNVSLA